MKIPDLEHAGEQLAQSPRGVARRLLNDPEQPAFTATRPHVDAPALVPESAKETPVSIVDNLLPMSPDLETQPELASTIFNAAGLAYINRGHTEVGRQYIERALDIRRNFYGEEHPAVADSLQSRARLLRHDGQLDAAEADIRRALSIHCRVAGKDSLPVAATLWELAVIQLEKNELAAAKRFALEGLEIIDKLYLERADPHVPRLWDVVARVHTAHGEYARAAEIYAKVLAAVEEKQGNTHPKYATYVGNLGTVEHARGNIREAEEYFSNAIAVYERVNGSHPNLSGIYTNMGWLQQSKGAEAFDAARMYYGKALLLSEKIWGRDHAFYAYDELSLGHLEFECGHLNEAHTLLEDALRIYRAQLPNSGYMANAAVILARIYLESHTPMESNNQPTSFHDPLQKAEALVTETLPIWRKEFGERSVEYAVSRATLARAWFLQGKLGEESPRILKESHSVVVELEDATHKAALLITKWLDALQSQTNQPAA